jgi:hypothetical protein
VTVQVFWAGQLVGATCPLKVATICPLVLKKLEPAMVMLCPAAPLEGLNEEMAGGPLGATATVVGVEVVVEVEVDVELPAPCPLPRRGLVDGEWEGATVVTDRAAVEGGEAGLATRETIKATVAATTSAATTATAPISLRSGPEGRRLSTEGRLPPGGVGGPSDQSGMGLGGGRAAGLNGGTGGGGAAALPDSRARRTAFSIAPRAR